MSVRATAQDAMSAEKKSSVERMIEDDMIAKPILEYTKNELGVDAFNMDPEELPEDDEEKALYMNLKYKPKIEIANEIAINCVLEDNKYFTEIKPRLDYDQVSVGKSVARRTFMPNHGIKLDYCDPAMVVHSYTEDPFYKDGVFYWGEVKSVHYTEIAKYRGDLTAEQIEDYKKHGGDWYEYLPKISHSGMFANESVMLLHFNYKTVKNFKFKSKKLKNGGVRIKPKGEDFLAESNELFDVISIPREVWYSGVLILGTNELIKWELCKNMVRPDSTGQTAIPEFVACSPRMYKGVVKSLNERMIPFADQIQLSNLKLQQIKSRMVPDGVYIDADAINEIDMGTGGSYNPKDALNLYFETGSVIGRSYTQDGDFNNAQRPIQELNTSSMYNKMMALVNDYNHNINQIRDVTGLNQGSDASTPDPDSLVGLQKLAALNSNKATKHILDASKYITEEMCNGISYMVADVLGHPDMAEEFAMKIGRFNMSILEEIKSLPTASFGIYIDLAPDAEEKAQLENNIGIALSQQTIELEDAIEIRTIKNITQANELLKVKRKRRMKMRQEREDMMAQMQGQINMQSQQAAAEAAMMKVQAEAQAKIAVEQAKADNQIRVLEAEKIAKSELMDKEFAINMELKGIEVGGQIEKQKKAEEAKDKRVDKQATAQSKLIDQRKNNLPPIDFESTNDNLGDFDLETFEPK
jgi:hypothetical protein